MSASLGERVAYAIRHPRAAFAAALARAGIVRPPSTQAPDPDSQSQLRQYSDLARRAGLEGVYLFLSFDCDTDEDVEAACELQPRLMEAGIRATYAVPGAQLRRGASAYQGLADAGAVFINHGERPHAQWHEDHYRSITFYNEMDEQEVMSDMRAGHHTVTEVIGRAPLGFRAPHFGCYQEPAQLALIHRTAAALGYRYCSGTLPSTALESGPVFPAPAEPKVVEIPVFGSLRYPTTGLDSWTYLTDRKAYRLDDLYSELFEETMDFFLSEQLPGVLSYYVDPSHVVGQAAFDRVLAAIARAGVVSVTGEDLVRLHARRGVAA